MKWKCTYQPEEALDVGADLGDLLLRHPGAKVRRKKGKGETLVIYLEDRLSKANIPLAKPPLRWYNTTKE